MWIWIAIIAGSAIHGLLFMFFMALLRASAPDELTRKLDDEEQIEYLRKWKERRQLKGKRRGRRKPGRTDRS